jgi:Crp-like helix-turn-helix domain
MKKASVDGSASKGFELGNNLLKALRQQDLALLRPRMEEVDLVAQQIIYEAGDDVDYVYFPCGPTLISFVVVLGNGKDVETALVGREGAVGGIVNQGHLPAYARSIVQYAGPALRMKCYELEKAKAESATLRHFFARYADCLMAQIFQCVACNAVHSIEQRAAKWLLAAADRTGGAEIPLTQEQLSSILGVGRSYVSRVIQTMKARGLIEVGHRRMRIADEAGLAGVACDCNLCVKKHFDEVLVGVYPPQNRGADREAELSP